MGTLTVTEGFGLLTAIVGLAFVAVILSKKSNTVNVVKEGGNAFAKAIKAATFQS